MFDIDSDGFRCHSDDKSNIVCVLLRSFQLVTKLIINNYQHSDDNKYFITINCVKCIMEKELGTEVIKTTQTALGKYVKRPPLSDKLLRKPPFRFLHDIITAVLKSTGFFEGLFDENELVSDNVKDRESKINFLAKVISVLSSTTGKSIAAKPSKIVAGQEADKTNELLQCLAYALEKKLSSQEAVKRYKESLKAPSNDTKPKDKESVTSTKKSNDAKKLTSKSSEKLTTSKKELTTKNEKTKTNESKSKKKESEVKNESQSKKSTNKIVKKGSIDEIQSTKTNVQKNVIEPNPNKDYNNKINEELDNKSLTEVISTHKPNNLEENNKPEEPIYLQIDQNEVKLNSSYTILDNDLNSSSSSQDLMGESYRHEENDNRSELNEPEVKHSDSEERKSNDTAFKSESSDSLVPHDKIAPIKQQLSFNRENIDAEIKANETVRNSQTTSNGNAKPMEIVRPPSVRPSSSRPGAPRLREKIDNIIPEDNLLLAKVNIIAENSNIEEEEESSVIIVDQLIESEGADDQQTSFQSNEHGHLVQQILDSQKEYSQAAGKTEIEWQLGAHKAMDTVNHEIEQIRFNIQAMSRVANPLGKLLDHIQEDVEIMRQELQQWTGIYEEVSKDMVKQKTASEETLVPLQSRLKQLKMDIEEKHDKINDLKVLVHKNSTRIEKLLANGSVQ